MTSNAFHRLRICVGTMGLVVASESHALCTPSPCVTLTMNPNVQLAKLHPNVTHFQLKCNVESQYVIQSETAFIPVVNRGYVGLAPGAMQLPTAYLAAQPDNKVMVRCYLLLKSAQGQVGQAMAANPQQTITDANWYYVQAGTWNSRTPGGTIAWNHEATFPKVAAP